jgi:hypothetical protein
MAKVIIRKLDAAKMLGAKKSRSSKSAVRTQKVRTSNGKFVTVRSLDANSPTFGLDLFETFAKNVARARRENTKKLGKPDAPASGLTQRAGRG